MRRNKTYSSLMKTHSLCNPKGTKQGHFILIDVTNRSISKGPKEISMKFR